MTDERRREKRAPVLIEVLWEGKAGRYEARTSDLSVNGCFVDTIGNVSRGEIVRFKLRLPSEEWMQVEGVVTYAYPNVGFGIQFTNVSVSDKAQLAKLVKAGNA